MAVEKGFSQHVHSCHISGSIIFYKEAGRSDSRRTQKNAGNQF